MSCAIKVYLLKHLYCHFAGLRQQFSSCTLRPSTERSPACHLTLGFKVPQRDHGLNLEFKVPELAPGLNLQFKALELLIFPLRFGEKDSFAAVIPPRTPKLWNIACAADAGRNLLRTMQRDPSHLVGPRTSKEGPVALPVFVKKIRAPIAEMQIQKVVTVMLLVASVPDLEMNLDAIPLDTESVINPVGSPRDGRRHRAKVGDRDDSRLSRSDRPRSSGRRHQKETKRSKSQDRRRSPKRSRTRSRRRYDRTFERRSSSSPRRGITLVSRALLHRPPTLPPARSRQSSRNDAYQPHDDRPRHSSDDQAYQGGKGRSPPKQEKATSDATAPRAKRVVARARLESRRGRALESTSQRPSPQGPLFSPTGPGALMMDFHLEVRMPLTS